MFYSIEIYIYMSPGGSDKHSTLMDREISKSEIRKAAIKKWSIASGVVLAVTVAIFVAMHYVSPSVERSSLRFSEVDTGSLETMISGSGRVVPAFEQIINSPIQSRIVEVYCREGDSVDVGTPLLLLDLQSANTSLQKIAGERRIKSYRNRQEDISASNEISNLEMEIKVKEMAVSRLAAVAENERLLDSIGSGTGEQVRQAELALKTGRLELSQLRTRLKNLRESSRAAEASRGVELAIVDESYGEMARTLEDARLRSPRKAIVTYIANEIGRQVAMGEKVAVISDLDHFKVKASVAETFSDKLFTGAPAIVRVGKIELPARISNVTPQSKEGAIQFTVILEDDNNPRLRSGASAEVYVKTDLKENVVRVANSSYYAGPGSYTLWVLSSDGKSLQRRNVSLGESSPEHVEVLSGLSPGEKVVANDLEQYKSHETLRIND